VQPELFAIFDQAFARRTSREGATVASVTEVLQKSATATRCQHCTFGIRVNGVCDQHCASRTEKLSALFALAGLALVMLTIALQQ
jgi:hypothetical protein